MFPTKLRRARSPRRVLTITYYVEPRDLRMITIPVARVNMLLALGTLICAWSLGSVVYLGIQVISSFGKDGKDAVASVADVRAMGPTPAISEAPIKETTVVPYDYDEPSANDGAPAVVAEEKTKAPPAPSATKPETPERPEATLAQAVPAEPTATIPPPPEEREQATLALLEPTLTQKAQTVALSFTLKNLGKARAHGNVWGVAIYADADGELRKVASHAGIDVESPADVAKAGTTTTFGARRLTQKTLKFDPPVAGETIRGVTVYAYDEASKTLLEEEIDIR